LRFRLALSTVQTHVQNIERKLRARSRFDLAVRAIRSGLINPSAMQRG
jgi:DNA-binding NarL/FixJ family response regulator